MEYFKLNNGIQMPMAGIGVFTFTPAEAQAAIESALRDGIRLIDTANAYQNEKATGRAMKASGVKREDIYLVTKLWPSVYDSETAVDDTLRRLDTDYIDLLFLHQPTDNWQAGYRNIEKAVKAGKVRSIGISNFDTLGLTQQARLSISRKSSPRPCRWRRILIIPRLSSKSYWLLMASA